MIQYTDYVYYEGTNNPVANAEVSVYIANTTTLANLFTDTGGATPKNNPVTTDQTGMFTFAAAGGTYDLYFLGVKQFQISLNDATGLPDPLTIQNLVVTGLAQVPKLLINTATDLIPPTAYQATLQVLGGMFAQDVAALPWFASNGPGLGQICVYGATANRGSFSATVMNDTAGQAGGLYCFRVRTGGAWPITDDRLGTIAGGTLRSTGGSFNPVSIGFFADDDWVDGVTNGASIRFFTIKSNSTETQQERMRITNSGNLLVGRTTNAPVGSPPKVQIIQSLDNGGLYISDGVVETSLNGGTGSYSAAHVVGSTYITSSWTAECHIDAAATGPRLLLLRQMSDGSLVNAPNMCLGLIQFSSATSTQTPAGAAIRGYSEDIWTSGVNTPGRIEFQTVPAGSNVLATRMTIKNDGIVLIGTTTALNPTAKLQVNGDIYASGSISAGSISYTNVDVTGNLTFTSTGQFIRGDMSNATASSRLTVQTSTTNGNTIFDITPNGTGTSTLINLFSESTKSATAPYFRILMQAGGPQIISGPISGGTPLPLTLSVGNTAIQKLFASGNMSIGGTTDNGYKLEVIGNVNVTGSITAGALSYTNIDTTGNLTFTSTGQYIRGDMSNNTASSRLAFQSNTLNGTTLLDVVPNGTNTSTGVTVFNSSDRANSGRFRFMISSTVANIVSNAVGTGVILPLDFTVGTTNAQRIHTSGNISINTLVDDTLNKLQLEGSQVIRPSGYATPYPLTAAGLRVVGNTVPTSNISIHEFVDSGGVGASLNMVRNTLAGAYPASGSQLAMLRFGACDATGAITTGASITCNTEETWTDTAHGSSVRFSTTPLTTISPTERMRIAPSGDILINTATDDNQNLLQIVAGTAIKGGVFVNIAQNFTPPTAFNSPHAFRGVGNTVNSASIRLNMFVDNAANAHGLSILKSALDGSFPATGWSLGALRFGTFDPVATSDKTCAMIDGYSEEQLSATTLGSSLRFFTTAIGSATSVERMKVTSEGIVLIGSSIPVGPAKLQVTGDMTITGSFTAGSISYTDISATGNLNFTGTAQLITGPFTLASSAPMFQTTSVDSGTLVWAMPNGASRTAGFQAISASDRANYSSIAMYTGATAHTIMSGNTGTGALAPLRIQMQGQTSVGLSLTTASRVLIGTVTDDATHTLQLTGAMVNTPAAGFTWPIAAAIPSSAMRIYNTSATGREITINSFVDGTTGLGSRIQLFRNTASGGYPAANAFIGGVYFGCQNPSTGVEIPTSRMHSLASEQWTDSARGCYITFSTINNGTNVVQERLRISQSGAILVGQNVVETGTAKLQVVGNMRATAIPVYANNAAAIAGGLTAGDFYRTGADPDPVCVVH